MARRLGRRALVAGLAGTLAGCGRLASDGADGRTPNSTAAGDDGARAGSADGSHGSGDDGSVTRASADRHSIVSPDPYPDLTVEPDPVPDDADVAIRVETVDPFTEEHAARIAVELTNTADRIRELPFGVNPPYTPHPADHTDSEARLWLVPDEPGLMNPESPDGTDNELVPDAPEDGCWPLVGRLAFPDLLQYRELVPGQQLRSTYRVVADDEGSCLASGTYRTEDDRYPPFWQEDVEDEAWGFDVTLTA